MDQHVGRHCLGRACQELNIQVRILASEISILGSIQKYQAQNRIHRWILASLNNFVLNTCMKTKQHINKTKKKTLNLEQDKIIIQLERVRMYKWLFFFFFFLILFLFLKEINTIDQIICNYT